MRRPVFHNEISRVRVLGAIFSLIAVVTVCYFSCTRKVNDHEREKYHTYLVHSPRVAMRRWRTISINRTSLHCVYVAHRVKIWYVDQNVSLQLGRHVSHIAADLTTLKVPQGEQISKINEHALKSWAYRLSKLLIRKSNNRWPKVIQLICVWLTPAQHY